MSKIIKVSTDLEVTVHDFPQGTIREQNRQLCELIGNGCEMIEHVMPRRLYNELHLLYLRFPIVSPCKLKP